MFQANQIISATQLIRNFSGISEYIERYPQPLLITQKSKQHLVLIDADTFEELLSYKFKSSGAEPPVLGIKHVLKT